MEDYQEQLFKTQTKKSTNSKKTVEVCKLV